MLERAAAAARSGELAARTRGPMGELGRRSAQRLERQQLLADNSRRGVEAVQAASDERLVVRARELGFAGLEAYLRDRHAAGWSLVRTSAELAVAREKTARLLAALGCQGWWTASTPQSWLRCDASARRTWPRSCALSTPRGCRLRRLPGR